MPSPAACSICTSASLRNGRQSSGRSGATCAGSLAPSIVESAGSTRLGVSRLLGDQEDDIVADPTMAMGVQVDDDCIEHGVEIRCFQMAGKARLQHPGV